MIVCQFLQSYNVYAIKATPYPFEIKQPDGTTLTVKLHGDEYFRYMTTEDDVLIAKSADNFYRYARMDESGQLIPTARKAENIDARSVLDEQFLLKLQKPVEVLKIATQVQGVKKMKSAENDVIRKGYPLNGSPKTLIILVNFSDKNFVTSSPQTAYTNLLNESGYSTNGGTGSARDYFRDASNGVFQPQFDVVGPYTLPNNMAYYGENSSGNDKNPQQMVIDACKLADQNGVDFTQYDTDNDGYVDNIFIYYAGYNEAEGGPANSVWPHRWTLANTLTKFDGKTIFDYACTSELKGASGTVMCGICTFCHEFGHVLGLADYYDTADDTHYTVSYWNIMDEGAYLNYGRTPPTYSAYDRFFLGWLTPVELKIPQNVTLPSITSSNKAYLITRYGNHNLNGANPSPNEFFMLENRQRTGWDTFLPNSGMLVTHVFYDVSTWNANSVNNVDASMGFDIVEADGVASTATRIGDPFPGSGNVTSYSPKLRNGTVIGKPLTMIQQNSGVITFRFMGGGDVPVILNESDFSQFNAIVGTPSAPQVVKVSGKKLTGNISVSFSVKTNFEMKKESDPETAWGKSLTLTPVDSVVAETNIQIRYNPTIASFKATHNETVIMTAENAETVQIIISGKSTRPVYVVPPVANEATDVTLGSFKAQWEEVFDASGYYLTVYSVSDGQSQLSEGFDNGLTMSTDWTTTATKVSTSSVYSGKATPSILLQKTGEYIETCRYFQKPSGLSFFVRSVAEKEGSLLVEGWNGTAWSTIDNLPIITTLNTTKSYTFTGTENYDRFRLTFTRSSGQLAVDDVTALYNTNINMIISDLWVDSASYTVPNLVSERDHYYYVKASDKTLYTDNTIKYENITANSNLIHVKTLEDSNVKVLRALVQKDGSVLVIVPNTAETIYVYNVIGQLIQTVVPDANVVYISGLPAHQIYLLKAGNRRTKIIL